jgi:hypothetical protein
VSTRSTTIVPPRRSGVTMMNINMKSFFCLRVAAAENIRFSATASNYALKSTLK